MLSLLRPPKAVVRYAITAAELLTRSAGAFACEAALGWLEYPDLSDEVVQAAQATAASIGAQRRGTPASGPKVKPERETSTEPGRGQPSEQDQNGDTAMPEQSDAAVRNHKPRQTHEDRSKGSELKQEDSQGAGIEEQDGQPPVEYDDEQQAQDDLQYNEEYNASEQEQQAYDMQGSEDQADDGQQYEEEDRNSEQQQYNEGDDQGQQEDYPEDQQQYNEGVQAEESDRQEMADDEDTEGPAEPKVHDEVAGSGQLTEEGDEWDVSETGVASGYHCLLARCIVCDCTSLDCSQHV